MLENCLYNTFALIGFAHSRMIVGLKGNAMTIDMTAGKAGCIER